MKSPALRTGIIATSSSIPKVEFDLGVDVLREKGFEVDVHPSVYGQYWFYPASDEARAGALIEFALRPDLDLIWCARGGYGATHLLPYLEKAKKKLLKAKKKTLLGYSDATALLEWFRVNLGWKTIHSPMPALRTFAFLKKEEWKNIETCIAVAQKASSKGSYSHSLTPLYLPKSFKSVEAPVVGGNLFVWNSLLGTRNQGNARGKILFLEEIGENLGRINRMLHHLEQANGLKGVKAIVLGDFLDCPDSVANGLMEIPGKGPNYEAFLRNPPKEAMGPIRRIYPTSEAMDFVFQSLGERTGIPVFKGCPVGHGPNYHPLFLGKKHKLNKNGRFSLG